MYIFFPASYLQALVEQSNQEIQISGHCLSFHFQKTWHPEGRCHIFQTHLMIREQNLSCLTSAFPSAHKPSVDMGSIRGCNCLASSFYLVFVNGTGFTHHNIFCLINLALYNQLVKLLFMALHF